MKRSTDRILTTHVGALPGPLQGTQDTLTMYVSRVPRDPYRQTNSNTQQNSDNSANQQLSLIHI